MAERIIDVIKKDGRNLSVFNAEMVGDVDHILVRTDYSGREKTLRGSDMGNFWLSNNKSHAVWTWRDDELHRVIRFACMEEDTSGIWGRLRPVNVNAVNDRYINEMCISNSDIFKRHVYCYVPIVRVLLHTNYHKVGNSVYVAVKSTDAYWRGEEHKLLLRFNISRNFDSMLAKVKLSLKKGFLTEEGYIE